jgi:hypothetical protein
MMNERDQFAQKVDQLLTADHGHGWSIWGWLRRRANKHYEVFHNDDQLEGSSDVSNYVFELWRQWRGKRPGTINDGFGFWINGEIALQMDIPNVKATREFHNRERA